MNSEPIDFDAVIQFFGCYLHQDWPLEFDDWEAAASAFIADSDAKSARAVRNQLGQLLSLQLSEGELQQYLTAKLCCDFDPSFFGLKPSDWLVRLKTFFDDKIEDSSID